MFIIKSIILFPRYSSNKYYKFILLKRLHRPLNIHIYMLRISFVILGIQFLIYSVSSGLNQLTIPGVTLKILASKFPQEFGDFLKIRKDLQKRIEIHGIFDF